MIRQPSTRKLTALGKIDTSNNTLSRHNQMTCSFQRLFAEKVSSGTPYIVEFTKEGTQQALSRYDIVTATEIFTSTAL